MVHATPAAIKRTGLGTLHVCRTRLYDQGASTPIVSGSKAGDSIQTAFIADIPADCTPAMCSTVSHAAPNAAEISDVNDQVFHRLLLILRRLDGGHSRHRREALAQHTQHVARREVQLMRLGEERIHALLDDAFPFAVSKR